MSIEFIYPEFEVIRNDNRCIACRVCERQCANEVHYLDTDSGLMMSDETMLMCHKETHKRLIDSSLLFRKFCFRTFFFNADML